MEPCPRSFQILGMEQCSLPVRLTVGGQMSVGLAGAEATGHTGNADCQSLGAALEAVS